MVFNGSTAGAYGGAIYCRGIFSIPGGKLDFNGNTAYEGGAIYLSGEENIINGTLIFRRNLASNHGGAIASTGTGRNYLIMSGTLTFEKNDAVERGGAIYSTIPLTIRDSDTTTMFTSNRASDGGGIYCAQNFSLINGSHTFLSNQGMYYGGAFYLKGSTNYIRQ